VSGKRSPDKDQRRKSPLKLRRIYSGVPNSDTKLRALLLVLGHSDENIDRVIEERHINREKEADSTEG
jgi:hypothetical protein